MWKRVASIYSLCADMFAVPWCILRSPCNQAMLSGRDARSFFLYSQQLPRVQNFSFLPRSEC